MRWQTDKGWIDVSFAADAAPTKKTKAKAKKTARLRAGFFFAVASYNRCHSGPSPRRQYTATALP